MTKMTETNDIFAEAAELIKSVGKKYKYSESNLESFLRPDREIKVSLPININGRKKVFTGYRVQHNNARGPYKGGVRFHQNVSRDEVKVLSLWMSLKTALVNLPFGGSKGGVVVNPKELTEKELESLSREYVRKLYDVIGPDKDIPAPDVNTNPKIISWMIDEYIRIAEKEGNKFSGDALFGAFTGKPIEKNGLDGRVEATGFGGAVVLNELAKKLGRSPKDTTVAIQGFGNVGYYFSKFASDFGFKIVTVSDSKGGVTDKKATLKNGLDVEKVLECKLEKGMLAGCYCVGGVCDINEGKRLSNEELLELPVDVLVPSALENVITEKNMGKIKAKIIVEMANGPTSPTAHEYLSKKGVVIVPDILANSGGVTASYLEWKQNIEGGKYKKEEVLEELRQILSKAFAKIWNEGKNKGFDLRTASYGIALKNILE